MSGNDVPTTPAECTVPVNPPLAGARLPVAAMPGWNYSMPVAPHRAMIAHRDEPSTRMNVRSLPRFGTENAHSIMSLSSR
jgi:hypothetical protein